MDCSFNMIQFKTFQMVKKISASIMQCIDIAMFTGGHAKARVASLETTEGCPIAPGSSLQKVTPLPLLQALSIIEGPLRLAMCYPKLDAHIKKFFVVQLKI